MRDPTLVPAPPPAPTAVTAPRSGRPVPPRLGRAVPALLVALPVLVAGAAVLVGAGRPFSYWGDKAVQETAVQQALAGDLLLGPHSNWGFHHPGPLLSYALAPVYLALGRAPLGLALGALVVVGACAVAVVVVAGRLLGRAGSWAAAAVVALHLWSWSPSGAAEHWNPAVVPLPLLLATLCWAGAWRGSAWWLVAGALPASFVVQSHLGTVPLVAAAAASGVVGAVLAAAGRARARGRAAADGSAAPPVGPAPGRPRPAVAAGLLVALALVWVAPVAEQLTASPGRGNLELVLDVALGDGPRPGPVGDGGWSARQVVGAVANEATRVPFRWAPAPSPTLPVDLAGQPLDRGRVALWALGVAVAGGLVVLGLARRRPVLAGLGAATLATTAAALLAAARVPEQLANYQLWGASVSLLPTWIGAGAVAAGALRSPAVPGADRATRAVRVGLGAVAVAAVVGFCVDVHVPTADDEGRRALAAADAVVALVPPGQALALTWQPDLWPVVPGVLASARREGADVRLVGPVEAYVGRRLVVDGRERGTVLLTAAAPAAGVVDALTPEDGCPAAPVGTAEGLAVWFSAPGC